MSRIKICGVTEIADLRACIDAGVDAVGINFWRGSKRYVTRDRADDLLRGASDRGDMMIVGVFVDADVGEVARTARSLALDAIQLHGDALVEGYAALGIPYVLVLRGTPVLESVRIASAPPMWILLDAFTASYGGAGATTDWSWAHAAVQHFAPLPVWLAGGIHPNNAHEALRQVDPAGLDVASGAEREGASHGEKDASKIATLCAICHKWKAQP